MIDPAAALTNLGVILTQIDQLEGLVSTLRLSAIGPVNGEALLESVRNVEEHSRALIDAIRVEAHAARQALDGE